MKKEKVSQHCRRWRCRGAAANTGCVCNCKACAKLNAAAAQAPHTWVEVKPDSNARKYGVTHTCRCGAAKGDRSYLAGKPCRIKALMEQYRECVNCCRGGTLVTQAFTRYICRLCNEEHNHPNGDTPAICQDCSKRHNVCRKCGGPLS